MTITRDETRYGEAFLTRQSYTYLVVCKRFSTFPLRKSFFLFKKITNKIEEYCNAPRTRKQLYFPKMILLNSMNTVSTKLK